jgi:hypothetical protein
MSCTYNLRKGSLFYQNMVTRYKNMLSMKHYIEVFEADTDNACATLHKKCSIEPYKPVITYNPRFISKLNSISPWAARAVFAHEVAHHYNGDLYGAYQAGYGMNYINYKSHRQELDADYVAGWILAWEGAPLDQTTLLYYIIDMPATNSHPATPQRVQSATRGWRDARRQMAA